MTASATSVQNRQQQREHYPRGTSIDLYGGFSIIIISPFILAAALAYGAYAGTRLLAKKLTILTNKPQAERLKTIFSTSLQLEKLQKTKNEAEELKTHTLATIASTQERVLRAKEVEAMQNPLVGMIDDSLKNGPQDVLRLAFQGIETEKTKAKTEREAGETALRNLCDTLEANEKKLKQTNQQITEHQETLRTVKNLYQQAGPLSKIKEKIILWQPFSFKLDFANFG